MVFFGRILFLGIGILLFGCHAFAGMYTQIVDVGACFHTGPITKSLNGSNSYFLNLGAEKRKGFFRPTAAAEVQFGSGIAYVDDAQPNFTLFGGDFVTGFHIFPFTIERFQPFFGAKGIIGWNELRLTGVAADEPPHTQSLVFGYELTAGVDMRYGSAEGTALRLRSSFWSTSGSLAGQSGFSLSGFRMSLGLVF
jgi:hypothetical protein